MAHTVDLDWNSVNYWLYPDLKHIENITCMKSEALMNQSVQMFFLFMTCNTNSFRNNLKHMIC